MVDITVIDIRNGKSFRLGQVVGSKIALFTPNCVDVKTENGYIFKIFGDNKEDLKEFIEELKDYVSNM
jgi:hypothetical protein